MSKFILGEPVVTRVKVLLIISSPLLFREVFNHWFPKNPWVEKARAVEQVIMRDLRSESSNSCLVILNKFMKMSTNQRPLIQKQRNVKVFGPNLALFEVGTFLGSTHIDKQLLFS